MRPFRLPVVVAALLACQPVLPAQAQSETEAKNEYRERLKAARRAPDPKAWLRLGEWIERQQVSERTRKEWLTYIRHQYGVAAHKKLDDHDVDGWLALARKMEELLGSDSVARSYLAKALEKNPNDKRLLAALGRDARGKARAASIGFAARKEEAERQGTAAAFRDLAEWCQDQIPLNEQARDWYDYCHARSLYLSGRGSGPTDPIQRALAEAEAKGAAPTRAARDPHLALGSHLLKREWKGMKGEEFRSGELYRLESDGGVSYSGSLPIARSCDVVWKRGTRTSATPFSDTQIMIEDHEVWWRLKWDDEADAWVPHTRAEHREARKQQIAHAHERLAQAQRDLERSGKEIDEQPGDAERARQAAERIAREGGKVRDFRRALQSIVNTAGSANHERVKQAEARRTVAAWKQKIAELEATPPK